MLLPCEVVVKFVLPSVRAALAKRLMLNYGFKQIEVAKLLGVSQPAISLYSRRLRGGALNVEDYPDIMEHIDLLAKSFASGNVDYKFFVGEICNICRVVRAKGLLCRFHKLVDSECNLVDCDLCKSISQKC
jgi:predicted transcriptional regulator